jgi:hypothetical protein
MWVISGQNNLGSCKLTSTMSVLDVLTDQSELLITALVRADTQRAALESGIVQAVRDHKCSVNDVSAATGVTVQEIRQILARNSSSSDLATLAGDR